MQEENNTVLQVGDRFPLTIKKIGINGEGVGYFKRKATFVNGAITGEEIVCEVKDIHDKYIIGTIHKFRKKSPNRSEEFAELSSKVGGLELAHLKYSEQLRVKKDILKQALDRYQPGGYKTYKINDMIGMKYPLEYRNKAQFQVRRIDGKLVCGLYQHGTQDVYDLEEMPTQMPLTMEIISKLKTIIDDLDIPIYDPEQNSGIIKTIVVRESSTYKNAQLTFITNSKKLPKKRDLITKINQEIPEIISISQNVNQAKTGIIWGEETTLLWGEKYLKEKIDNLTFNLSPRAFLQLNPEQMRVLYKVAHNYLKPSKNDNLFDAYCGVGTIGLSFAHEVREVFGAEIVPEAIEDAQLNAQANNITNDDYRVGTAEDVFEELLEDKKYVNALIVDPPRTGIEEPLLEKIVRIAPQKMIYISCNPSTLAKDLRLLSQKYIVDELQPVDMFPQTPHVETVVNLIKK